jgi:hypothetical protein
MVDTRRRNRNPYDDDNGYGDVPGGAVGSRGDGREYPGGYGSDANEFAGGDPNDDDSGPPRDDDRDRPLAGSHRGRGPKGYKRSDQRIHEDVCERLTEDRFIDASNIEVEVKEGEVTLSGTVSSRGLKRRAEDLAEMAAGVSHIQNNLRVEGV